MIPLTCSEVSPISDNDSDVPKDSFEKVRLCLTSLGRLALFPLGWTFSSYDLTTYPEHKLIEYILLVSLEK